MALVYLGLGSNLGDKRLNILQGIQEIELTIGELWSVSEFYESEAWGFESENQFLNAALLVKTGLAPLDVLHAAKEIERKMGRVVSSSEFYEDRIIDVDILLYDTQIVNHPALKIPHPLMQKRDFVLVPLAEIAADIVHPVYKKSIAEMRDSLLAKMELEKSLKNKGGEKF